MILKTGYAPAQSSATEESVYTEIGTMSIYLDNAATTQVCSEAAQAALDAIKVELDRQIAELGGDPERSGLDEVVRDWMLREHPEERKFMDDFSETVTFRELAERMEAGEDFYDILDSTESQQREYVFARLADITDKDYDHWYYTWLSHGDKAKYDEYIAKRKAVIKAARRKRKSK